MTSNLSSFMPALIRRVMWCTQRITAIAAASIVMLVIGGSVLPIPTWAAPCLVPTKINEALTPIIAGSGGLTTGVSFQDNRVSADGVTYKHLTDGTEYGSLDADKAALSYATLELKDFSPSIFPNTGTMSVENPLAGNLAPGSYDKVTVGTYSFPPGNYYIDSLVILPNLGVTLTLNAGDYFIRNFIHSKQSGYFAIKTTGTVRLFIGSSFSVSGGVDINSSGNVKNLQIFLYPGATAKFGSNGSFKGLIYAPGKTACNNSATNTCITFNDAHEITGSILSNSTVTIGGFNTINFSSAIRSAIGSIEVPGCTTGPDHYELSLPASGISCLTSPVTVTACKTATAPCTSADTSASGTSVTLETTAGTLGATDLTFDATGKAATTLSYPAASNDAKATVKLKSPTGTVKCCQDGSCADSTAASCTETFKTAKLIFSASATGDAVSLPNVTSACKDHPTSATYYLRSVQSGTTTGACVVAPINSSVTKKIRFGYQCNNPASCSTDSAMAVNSTTISSNANGANTNTQDVSLDFDANGSAKITFDYFNDAGKVTLFATLPADNTVLSALSTEATFIVAPAKFALSGIPAAPLTAGDPFNITVTAQNACNSTTPSFGKETTAATATLTSSNPTPAIGNASDISATLAGFTNGAASTNLTWLEVGKVDLTATTSNYLGSTLNVTGKQTGVGRFRPAYFDVTQTLDCAKFNYAGQPFKLVTVTAKNSSGHTTKNHTGTYVDPISKVSTSGYAKDVTLSTVPFPETTPPIVLYGGFTDTTNKIVADVFKDGVANATPIYAFPDKLIAPEQIALRATDTDTRNESNTADIAAVSSKGHAEPNTIIRSGRLILFNAWGSAKANLQMPLQAQYWSGKSWVINSDDSCTTLPANAFARSGTLAEKTSVASAVTLAGGNATATLSAPTDAASGSVDIALNLGSSAEDQSCLSRPSPLPTSTGARVPWLRSRNGDCATTYDKDPWARATFGIYSPETRRLIYVQDVF